VGGRSRHRLYRKLEEVLGHEEAATLMEHLPPAGFEDLATRKDLLATRKDLLAELDCLEHRLTATMESLARRLVMWTSSMVLAAAALPFAAGRFA
jgi:hypothetical protein